MTTFDFITLQWQGDDESGALFLIAQTQLSGKQSFITCQTLHEVARVISTLQVRGAPAIGVAAAYGIVLGSRKVVRNFNTPAAIREAMQNLAHELNKTRPTEVNLSWAIDEALMTMEDHFSNDGECRRLPAAILKRAHEIYQADRDACEKMGEYGAPLIADNASTLTHCNVVAPTSTIDFHIATGTGIPIEERDHAKATHIQGQMIAPAGIHASNPATERGIVRPPFNQTLPTLVAGTSKHNELHPSKVYKRRITGTKQCSTIPKEGVA